MRHLPRSLMPYLLMTGGFLLTAAIYFPGLAGPYVFDDSSNLLTNEFLKLTRLDVDSLYHAMFSLGSGPLRRPLSALSFALNHYFAGGFTDPLPFKATNLAIHLINTLLLFFFARLLFARLVQIEPAKWSWAIAGPNRTSLLAAGFAILWAVAPIQLTSVLYVVQRMVSLAALFTLMALISYLSGRIAIVNDEPRGKWLLVLGTPLFWIAALLCKENAALLPLFLLLLEVALFSRETPWNRWSFQPPKKKYALIAIAGSLVVTFSLAFLGYALEGYGGRSFTPVERVLTESRVLWLYLALIVVPDTSLFGLNHDDIALSTSLVSPLTTLPATIGIIALLTVGFATLRRYPLLATGILWFFSGHLLESTVIGLEIAHEHRNYLPSAGVYLAAIHFLNGAAHTKLGHKTWFAIPAFIAAFAATTTIRSLQWSDPYTFALYEAIHHPNSARAHTYLAVIQYQRGLGRDAMQSLRRAAYLTPKSAVDLINMHLIEIRFGLPLTDAERLETTRRLTDDPRDASTLSAIQNIDTCLASSCRPIAPTLEHWTRAVLRNPPRDEYSRAFYLYMLGRSLSAQGKNGEAVAALLRAAETDRQFLHPLFAAANIYLREGRWKKAEETIAMLRDANAKARFPRDAELSEIMARLETLKESAGRGGARSRSTTGDPEAATQN